MAAKKKLTRSQKNTSIRVEFSQKKISFPRENISLDEFNSTLLIPEKYFILFLDKASQRGGVREYVGYLLSKYQIYIANGLVPGYSQVTTKYQEKGQNLQKISFRPFPADWVELKLYRVSFGMSISAFLMYLVIADSVDFAEATSNYLVSVGISVLPEFDLSAKVYLCNKRFDYTTVFQYRKSRLHH